MKISIIGHSSFIANCLLNKYADCQITILGKNDYQTKRKIKYIPYHYPDDSLIDDQKYKYLSECDIIYYFAGAGIQPDDNSPPVQLLEMNAFEPIRLHEMLKETGFSGQLVTFGSYFEIGITIKAKSYNEVDFISHSNLIPSTYGVSKRVLSIFIDQFYKKDYLYSWAHFVLPNVYGNGENSNRLFPYIINSIKNNQPIKIGKGNNIRQFIHVNDVISLMLNLKDRKVHGMYHLGSKDSILVDEAIKLVVGLSERRFKQKAKINRVENIRPDQILPFLSLNDDRARSELGWQDSTILNDGILDYF
jgi:nucleoside-diphosphate-sugar epimerase